MRTTARWGAALLALAATTATTAPAVAAPKPRVDVAGQGTHVLDATGAAVVTGSVTGTPFDGGYLARLTADDGALPQPGECEAATATVRIEGSRSRHLELAATGTACGQHLQPPYVVAHVFTGRYDVTASSVRRLLGTDGFVEVRLATEGRASVFAIDT